MMNKIKNKFVDLFKKLRYKIKNIKPLSDGWKGASISLIIITLFLYIMQSYYLFSSHGFWDFIKGAFVLLLAILLIGSIISILIHFMKKVPSGYILVFISSFILIFISFLVPIMQVNIIVTIFTIISFSLLGSLIYKFTKGSYKNVNSLKKITTIALSVVIIVSIGLGGYWIVNDGNNRDLNAIKENIKENKRERKHSTSIQNPSLEGPYKVKKLSYGSEKSYRKEFNEKNSIITNPVDGSAFLEKSLSKWSSSRRKFLGFGPENMPLNGLVWYPEGEGAFPLVVIAHGNHIMTDYSDPGYEYLGQLLASRGYIVASIDENFLNSSPYDDKFMLSVLEGENPARGFLMLEHLKVWKEWNKDVGNDFYNKVDMNNIALIGHSRGGEAITIATVFNKLKAYPEDGNVKFDYNFNIRSIIAIAATDKQYKPSGNSLPLKDVNYLALHGAHDMDVSSFSSSDQYNRIDFTDGSDYFKSSIYIYGANHGQFNSSWGREDAAGLGNRFYNTKQLISEEEQQKISKVLITSFLETTLKNNTEYREVFKDIEYASKWLPDTLYVNNYFDSNTKVICSYNDDIDVNSTTIDGGKITGENLSQWKEERVKLKYAEGEYSAVRLGWDINKNPNAAMYNIILPNKDLNIKENSKIVFSLADGDEKKSDDDKNLLIDLTIKVEDMNGNKSSLPLSHFSYLPPMIQSKILKAPFSSFLPIKEPVFKSFEFNLEDFKKANANFNPEQLAKISFQFDKTERGTVLLNDVGIRY